MKISYSILTHNETETLQQLLDFLIRYKDDEDEIVILDDFSDNEQTKEILDAYVSIYEIKFEQRYLLEDFGGQKNYLRRMCTGDYIFNLDADELISKKLIKSLKPILKANWDIDVYWLPRINTVDGITEEYIVSQGWTITDQGWINWHDPQCRIHKNRSNIRWKNKVHETLEGYTTQTHFPAEEQYAILHHKTFENQVEQNKFYEGIK